MSASTMSSDPEDSDASSPPALLDQILEHLVESEFPVDSTKQRFLPQGKLDDLITKDSIAQEFELADSSKKRSRADNELIDLICKSAKKVFATALFSGLRGKDLRKAMSRFKRHGFSDQSLPVKPEFDKLSYVNDKPWNMLNRFNFRDNQWRFLAPVFPNPTPDADLKMVLEPEHILPFTYVDEQRREGTFGNVYQVTIHPKHQEIPMKKVNPYHNTLVSVPIVMFVKPKSSLLILTRKTAN